MCTTQPQLDNFYSLHGVRGGTPTSGHVVVSLDQFPNTEPISTSTAVRENGQVQNSVHQSSTKLSSPKALIVFAVIAVFTVLFVGWEVAERHLSR